MASCGAARRSWEVSQCAPAQEPPDSALLEHGPPRPSEALVNPWLHLGLPGYCTVSGDVAPQRARLGTQHLYLAPEESKVSPRGRSFLRIALSGMADTAQLPQDPQN